MKRKQKRPAPVIESLEPRILLSADFPGLDAPEVDPNDPWNADVDQILARAYETFEAEAAKSRGGSSVEVTEPAHAPVGESDALLSSSGSTDAGRRELIIVDPSVPDYELLLADVSAVNGEGTRLDVVMIDPQRKGIDQVTQVLLRHSELDAIHLISHGGAGQIKLGNEVIDLNALQRSEDLVRSWGDALTVECDVLIYGCNVAATDAGLELIGTLAELTHADVAASNDLTGHVSQDGDWDLESRIGSIETAVFANTETQEDWQAVLATATVTTTADNNDAGIVDGNLSHDISWLVANQGTDTRVSLREAIIAANNTPNGGSPDAIHFEIPDALGANGAHTISVSAGGLPGITDAVIIDGTTDADFSGMPMIELKGAGGSSGKAVELAAGSSGSTVRGLVINEFAGNQAVGLASDNHIVVGNFIGTNVAGDAIPGLPFGVNIAGIYVQGAGNVIGGVVAEDKNIIAGSWTYGVHFNAANNNQLIGNFIGTNAAGDDLGNGTGVFISSTPPATTSLAARR